MYNDVMLKSINLLRSKYTSFFYKMHERLHQLNIICRKSILCEAWNTNLKQKVSVQFAFGSKHWQKYTLSNHP